MKMGLPSVEPEVSTYVEMFVANRELLKLAAQSDSATSPLVVFVGDGNIR